MRKAVFNWSGGKDSALALHYVLKAKKLRVEKLLTSINQNLQRISMHGVRRSLLEIQTNHLGIDSELLLLPDQPEMDDYNRIMEEKLMVLKKDGITESIFGDIFLEDLRKYREEKSKAAGFQVHFPLWKRNTMELMHEFLDLGFKTIVVCVNGNQLGKEFSGRVIDRNFLKELPSSVDPCGENGEFHTFVFDGPDFIRPVPFQTGETISRTYPAPAGTAQKEVKFWFTDLLPVTEV